MRRAVLLIFCSFLLGGSIMAQRYVFMNYGINDGLAHSQVRSLFQDKNSVLWIGTLGGVNSYDGQDFKSYTADEGLLGNEVGAITQLADGNLILGGRGGMSVFNGRSFSKIKFQQSWKESGVNTFLISGDSLLIATESGLASLAKNKLNYFPTLFEENDKNLKSIQQRGDTLWLLTKKTLFKWTPAGLEKKITSSELSQLLEAEATTFMDLSCDEQNRLYITTSGLGLIEIKGNSIDKLSIEEGLVSNVVNKVTLDDKGNLLVCSSEGFSHLKNDGLVSFTEENGLEYADVRTVLQDHEGRYWIGTNGGGLYKFSGYGFTYFTTQDGLSSNAIMTIGKSVEGGMFFGSYGEGVAQTFQNRWSYLKADKLANNKVWSSAVDAAGNKWFGTSEGISVVSGEDIIHQITTAEGLDYKKITALYTDEKREGVWAGSSRGLNFIQNFKPEVMSSFTGDRVRAIEPGDDELFIASRQGVWCYKDTQFKLLPIAEELEDRTVYCLKWLNGILWAGTKNGLYKYAQGTSEKVFLSENFSFKVINFLEGDAENNIWVGTNLGLFKISPDSEIESFTEQDGLISLETNLNAVYQDGNHLWFGTNMALQKLDFQELNSSRTLASPEVVLKDVRLNLSETNWGAHTKHFFPGTAVPVHPTVKHKDNNFSFRFHATSVEEKSNLRYQYKLEGYDEDWQPVTQEATATYTNLPFKSFQFKVRAKRLGQQWGEPMVYPFSIQPPFWQTWWFILIASFLTIYMAWRIFKYRRQNLIMALEKEKFEIRSKMLALEQQSLNSSMNRHFIFNALNSIQYYINKQDRLSANRYLSSFANLIRKNLDSSQVNFTSLADELERLELYLEIENMRFKDKFDYQIAVSPDIDEEVVKIPSMLLQPYLENSIWHGILPQEKKGEIRVIIKKNQLGQMEIRITDNGIGIFTSQAQKNGKAAHISKGMNITSGRLELLKKITDEKVILIGPFEIKDENDQVQGTQVTIKLPLEYKEIV